MALLKVKVTYTTYKEKKKKKTRNEKILVLLFVCNADFTNKCNFFILFYFFKSPFAPWFLN